MGRNAWAAVYVDEVIQNTLTAAGKLACRDQLALKLVFRARDAGGYCERQGCQGEEKKYVFHEGVDGGVIRNGEEHVAQKHCSVSSRKDEQGVRSAEVCKPQTAASGPAR